MEISVQSNNAAFINADRLYQQPGSPQSRTASDKETNFLQTLIEKEQQMQVEPARDTVLSLPEMETLHVLFGSEKPDNSSFYGRNNTAQIYKGHLLDVAG